MILRIRKIIKSLTFDWNNNWDEPIQLAKRSWLLIFSEDPDRPCRVACQDDTVSHRFYLVNGENGWFPFGTACSKGNEKSFCVTGKCLEFGKDDTPLHESIFALPLLSRYKRSAVEFDFFKELHSRQRRNLEHDKTVIISQLNQRDLDTIISRLNFSGQFNYQSNRSPFQIDLNNPIHIPMDQFDRTLYNYAWINKRELLFISNIRFHWPYFCFLFPNPTSYYYINFA